MNVRKIKCITVRASLCSHSITEPSGGEGGGRRRRSLGNSVSQGERFSLPRSYRYREPGLLKSHTYHARANMSHKLRLSLAGVCFSEVGSGVALRTAHTRAREKL